MPPVPEPQIDGVTGEILNAYAVISRSRAYAGMTGSPLPLSIRDIEQYMSVRPIQIDRDEFETAIFALDDAWRDEWAKKQEQDRKKK